MPGCPFCAIVAREAPAHIVDEDADTLAFLDIAPFTVGHTLVVPKRHTDDLWSADAQTAAAVMRTAHRVAGRLRDALDLDGVNLLQATRAIAFQTVFHLHLHVIPRTVGDGVSVPPWRKAFADRTELAELAARLRATG